MEILYIIYVVILWTVCFAFCLYISIIAISSYKEGYSECYQKYHKDKQVSSYEDAITPYQLGWNNAFKEIYNKF